VEVGGYDGYTFSHSWGLAVIGWRGVYVEPMPDLFAECAKRHIDHPLVTVLRCAAAGYKGEALIYIAGDKPWGSSLSDALNKVPARFMVPTRTLDDILEFEDIEPQFDLLTIDTEFTIPEVLDGFTLKRWLPKMIVVELHEKHDQIEYELSGPARTICNKLFPKWGAYQKVYADNTNTVYAR
jgi:FkbM family methyltransferase